MTSFLRVAKKGAAKYRVVSVWGPIDLKPKADLLVYFLVEIFAIIPCEVVLGNAVIYATVAACLKHIAVHGESPKVPSVFT